MGGVRNPSAWIVNWILNGSHGDRRGARSESPVERLVYFGLGMSIRDIGRPRVTARYLRYPCHLLGCVVVTCFLSIKGIQECMYCGYECLYLAEQLRDELIKVSLKMSTVKRSLALIIEPRQAPVGRLGEQLSVGQSAHVCDKWHASGDLNNQVDGKRYIIGREVRTGRVPTETCQYGACNGRVTRSCSGEAVSVLSSEIERQSPAQEIGRK